MNDDMNSKTHDGIQEIRVFNIKMLQCNNTSFPILLKACLTQLTMFPLVEASSEVFPPFNHGDAARAQGNLNA